MDNGQPPPDVIESIDAPAVPGLVYRRFRGEADYPEIARIANASREADGLDWTYHVESIAADFRHLVNCDPQRDVLIVEVGGEVVGYGWTSWRDEHRGRRVHRIREQLLPEWRGMGIRRSVYRYLEDRCRAIAAGLPEGSPDFLQAWTASTEDHKIQLIEAEGFLPTRWFFEMERDLTADIPDPPMPGGLEVRPVGPEDYYGVFKASEEANHDHWGARDWHDDEFEAWREDPNFQPELWQVAWDGEDIAGMVLAWIDERENEEFGRKRGYPEDIAVCRPYRRKGLATALLARSMRLLRQRGMTVANLGVDTENPNGALGLYRSLGFEVIKKYTVYMKPLDARPMG